MKQPHLDVLNTADGANIITQILKFILKKFNVKVLTFEFVGRGSEAQIQVSEHFNFIYNWSGALIVGMYS